MMIKDDLGTITEQHFFFSFLIDQAKMKHKVWKLSYWGNVGIQEHCTTLANIGS